MDEVSIDLYRRMVARFRCSAEEIVENPERRAVFLSEARQVLGNLPEYQLLHRLSYLRK